MFISFRRDTEAEIAGQIKLELEKHGYDAYVYTHDQVAGKYKRELRNEIRARKDFLIIIGPHSLDRWMAPRDWLRWEFRLAVKTHRNIVPVFVGGFEWDKPSELSKKLLDLYELGGISVTPETFTDAMARIRRTHLTSCRRLPLLKLALIFMAILLSGVILAVSLPGTTELTRMEMFRQQAEDTLEQVEWQDELLPVLTRWEREANRLADTSLRNTIRNDIATMRADAAVLARPKVRDTLNRLATDISAVRDKRSQSP